MKKEGQPPRSAESYIRGLKRMTFNDLRRMGRSKSEIYTHQLRAMERMLEEELNEPGREITGGCDVCFPPPNQPAQ